MLDAWTSANYIPFLGITVHWISSKWELKEILINFCKLSGSYSGENLYESFIKCCDNNMNILIKVYLFYLFFIYNFTLLLISIIILNIDYGMYN